MKNILYVFLAAVIMFFAACSDDFLDREPTGQLSSSQLADMANKDPDAVVGPLVTGLYSTTFALGTGGISNPRNDTDYGQKSIDMIMDMMSADMGLTSYTYGWYRDEYQGVSIIKTANRNYANWRYYYRLIKSANEIFDILGSDEEMPTNETAKAFYGQAKAIRAQSYFYLVNLYQHPYSIRQDKPGVPVYRTQMTSDPAAQSTVAEVYDLIISDYRDAAEALEGFNRGTDKTRINRNVALGLLAQALLMRGEDGDYQEAADAVQEVIASGQHPLMSATDIIESGFRSLSMPSWLWGMNLTMENRTGLAGFWGHMCYFTYGYAGAGDIKIIDGALYESIPNTDARKGQFGDPENDIVGEHPLAPMWKFWASVREQDYDRTWTNDYVYLRVEELYLIRAEALARADNLPAAKATLKALVELRDPVIAANIDTMTATEFLEAVYFNWRVEMWGEGRSLLAAKRFGKTVTRSDINHIFDAGKSFPFDDARMIFEIPENEQINNPYLLPQQD